MGELIKGIPQIIPDIRNGGGTRSSQSFGEVFTRMVGNLQGEYRKLSEEVEVLFKQVRKLKGTCRI
jgi:hypothetical protein